MKQPWILVLATSSMVHASGCDDCGRRLVFFTTVEDSSGAAVANATVTVDCVDASDGSHLSEIDTTDATGAAAPAVHALNRECPEDAHLNASYFRSCSISVRAAGFVEWTRQLSGAELDALPEHSAGQAGAGVRIEATLSNQ